MVALVCVNTEDGAADARSVVDLAEIMKESRESLAEMQKSYEKAAAEQAKTARTQHQGYTGSLSK